MPNTNIGSVSGQVNVGTGRSGENIRKLNQQVIAGMDSMEGTVQQAAASISSTMTTGFATMGKNVSASVEALEKSTIESFTKMSGAAAANTAAMVAVTDAGMKQVSASIVAGSKANIAAMQALEQSMVKTAVATNASLASVQKSIDTGFKGLGKSTNTVNKGLKSTKKAAGEVGDALEDMADDVMTLDKRLHAASIGLNSMGRGMTRLGGAMVSLAIPLAAIGVIGIATFAKFERSMGQAGVVMNTTAGQMDELEENVSRLGKTTIFTMTEVANAARELAKGGLEFDAVIGSLDATLNLAAAAGIEFERAAVIMTDILQGYKLEAEDAIRVTDQMAFAVTNASINFEEMARSMQAGVAMHNMFGWTEEANIALTQVMGNIGYKGTRAMTPWKMFGVSMTRLPGIEARMERNWESNMEIAQRAFNAAEEREADAMALVEENKTKRADWEKRQRMDLQDKEERLRVLETEDPMEKFNMEVRQAEDRVARAKQALVDLEAGVDAELGGYTFDLDLTNAQNALKDAQDALDEFIGSADAKELLSTDEKGYNQALRKLISDVEYADSKYHEMLARQQKAQGRSSGGRGSTPEQAALQKRTAETELADAEMDLRNLQERGAGVQASENEKERLRMELEQGYKELAEGPEYEKRAIESLEDAIKERNEAADRLAEVGSKKPKKFPLSIYDDQGNMITDPLVWMEQILKLKKSGYTMEDIYKLADQMNINRTGLEVFALVDEEFIERYKQSLEETQLDHEGAAEKLAEPGIEGIAGSFEKIKAAAEGAMVDGVNPFRDSLKELMDVKIVGWIEKLSERFSGLSMGNKELIAQLVIYGGVFGGLLLLLGRVTQGIGGMLGGLVGAVRNANTAGAQLLAKQAASAGAGTAGAAAAGATVGAGAAGAGKQAVKEGVEEAVEKATGSAVKEVAETAAIVGAGAGAANIGKQVVKGTPADAIDKGEFAGANLMDAGKNLNKASEKLDDASETMAKAATKTDDAAKAVAKTASQTVRPGSAVAGITRAGHLGVAGSIEAGLRGANTAAMHQVMGGAPMVSSAIEDSLAQQQFDPRRLRYNKELKRYIDPGTGQMAKTPTAPYFDTGINRWRDPASGKTVKGPQFGAQPSPMGGAAQVVNQKPLPFIARPTVSQIPAPPAQLRGLAWQHGMPDMGVPVTIQQIKPKAASAFTKSLRGLQWSHPMGEFGMQAGSRGGMRALTQALSKIPGAGRAGTIARGAGNVMGTVARGATWAPRAMLGAKGALTAGKLGGMGALIGKYVLPGPLGWALLGGELLGRGAANVWKDFQVSTGQAEDASQLSPWGNIGWSIAEGITGRDIRGERAYNQNADVLDQRFITDKDREEIAALGVSSYEEANIEQRLIAARKAETQALQEWKTDRDNIVETLLDPVFIDKLEEMGIDIWNTIPATLLAQAQQEGPAAEAAKDALSSMFREALAETGRDLDVELPKAQKSWGDRIRGMFVALSSPMNFQNAILNFQMGFDRFFIDLSDNIGAMWVHTGTMFIRGWKAFQSALMSKNPETIMGALKGLGQLFNPSSYSMQIMGTDEFNLTRKQAADEYASTKVNYRAAVAYQQAIRDVDLSVIHGMSQEERDAYFQQLYEDINLDLRNRQTIRNQQHTTDIPTLGTYAASDYVSAANPMTEFVRFIQDNASGFDTRRRQVGNTHDLIMRGVQVADSSVEQARKMSKESQEMLTEARNRLKLAREAGVDSEIVKDLEKVVAAMEQSSVETTKMFYELNLKRNNQMLPASVTKSTDWSMMEEDDMGGGVADITTAVVETAKTDAETADATVESVADSADALMYSAEDLAEGAANQIEAANAVSTAATTMQNAATQMYSTADSVINVNSAVINVGGESGGGATYASGALSGTRPTNIGAAIGDGAAQHKAPNTAPIVPEVGNTGFGSMRMPSMDEVGWLKPKPGETLGAYNDRMMRKKGFGVKGMQPLEGNVPHKEAPKNYQPFLEKDKEFLSIMGLSMYASGTGYSRAGMAVLGEQGPELVLGPSLQNLQMGSSVMDASETMDILNASQGPDPYMQHDQIATLRRMVDALSNIQYGSDNSRRTEITINGDVGDKQLQDLYAAQDFRDSMD